MISERFYVLLAALEKKILNFTSVVKQKPEMSDEVEIFLKYVLDRSQEINDNIHQENRGDCEYFLSEMLLHLENTKVPADVILVSMDVTNIPQEEEIDTVRRAYEIFYRNEPPTPMQLLKRALRLILRENSFQFNGKKLPSKCYLERCPYSMDAHTH